MLVSCSVDKKIKIYKISETGYYNFYKEILHYCAVNSVCFSECGKYLASGSADTVIKIWDILNNFQEIISLTTHGDIVSSVCFSKNGLILISGSWDRTIKIWDIVTYQEIITISDNFDSISKVSVSEDTIIIISCSKIIKSYSMSNFQELSTLFDNSSLSNSICFEYK